MALHLQEYFGWRSGRPVTAKLLKCAWLARIVRDFLGICYADAHRLPLSLRQEDNRPGEDGRAHDDGAGALGRRGRGGHRLLPALLRVVRPGLRGALRVAGAPVARSVSEVRDRRRADRRVGLAVYEPGALRGRADDPLAGGVGAGQDVPRRARDLGRLAAVRDGLRGPRVGRAPRVTGRAAPREADSRGCGQTTHGRVTYTRSRAGGGSAQEVRARVRVTRGRVGTPSRDAEGGDRRADAGGVSPGPAQAARGARLDRVRLCGAAPALDQPRADVGGPVHPGADRRRRGSPRVHRLPAAPRVRARGGRAGGRPAPSPDGRAPARRVQRAVRELDRHDRLIYLVAWYHLRAMENSSFAPWARE